MPVIKLLIKLNVSPNLLTVMGLFFVFVPAYFYLKGYFKLAGIFYILFSLFDTLDGELAREKGIQNPFGAFLDSSLDRIQEGIIFGALIYFFRENQVLLFLLYFSFLFSFLISYSRARAEGLGKTVKTGPMDRPLRILFISFFSLFGKKIFSYSIYVFFILVFYTFLLRTYNVYKIFKKGSNP